VDQVPPITGAIGVLTRTVESKPVSSIPRLGTIICAWARWARLEVDLSTMRSGTTSRLPEGHPPDPLKFRDERKNYADRIKGWRAPREPGLERRPSSVGYGKA